MKNEILFLAPYPDEHNIKDGMVSRVKAIDYFFINTNRTYLTVSLRNFKKSYYINGNVEVYNLNIILHFFKIIYLLRTHNHIYSHSIYFLSLLWPILWLTPNNVILDIHGVVPEEELYFQNRPMHYRYYSFIERIIFKHLRYAICVTNAMKIYYQNKYADFKGEFIIYSIMPADLKDVSIEEIAKIKFGYKNKIEVIYSGGTQNWQNIDLIMQSISQNQSSRIHYTILTGDTITFEKKIKEKNILAESISVESRQPSELWKDYIKADYAFILRDENIVNKVANPTKLIEYLYYGLIPIIISPLIGDYNEMGYHYIRLDQFNKDNLDKPKSINEKNKSIAQQMLKNNNGINLRNVILNKE